MTSWFTWPLDQLTEWLYRRREDRLATALREGEVRYLDAEGWARLLGTDEEEAHLQLEAAVRDGILKKAYLYEGGDSPISFVVPETLLDKPVRLSDIGDFSEETDREILVSRFRARPVYVASKPA